MTRLLLADDHPMIRAALEVLLRDTGFEIVGMAGSGEATLRALDELRPDLLLLDIQMPDGTGIDVLRRLRAAGSARRLRSPITSVAVRAAGSQLRVVLLTAAIDDAQLLEAKALKVQGIVLKNSDPAYLLDCLESVRDGRNWIDPELATRVRRLGARVGRRAALAPRERQLIGFVRTGMRNREIAEELGVTEGTVKAYLHAIFEKLGIGNRTELAIRADEFLAG